MCVFCFHTKKGHQIINLGPLTGRQPRKTSRGKSSRNCPDFNKPRCAGWEPQTVQGDRDSPRPKTSHPADSRTPGFGKHSLERFTNLKSETGKRFESTGETSKSSAAEGNASTRCACTHVRPPGRAPAPSPTPSSLPSPPPPPRRALAARAGSPRLLRQPRAHLHLPPRPPSARPPAWAYPPPPGGVTLTPLSSPRPHTPSAAETTAQETDPGLGS